MRRANVGMAELRSKVARKRAAALALVTGLIAGLLTTA